MDSVEVPRPGRLTIGIGHFSSLPSFPSWTCPGFKHRPAPPCNCSPSFGFRGCFHRCLSLQCISKLATSRRVPVPVHCSCASRVDWKQLSKEPSHSSFIGRTAVESTILYTELWWCSRPVAGSDNNRQRSHAMPCWRRSWACSSGLRERANQ